MPFRFGTRRSLGLGLGGGGAILKPQDVFAILAQPANAMQAAINALPFSPDILIGKDRVAAGDWSWRDSLTGLNNTLASNTTAAQAAWPGYSGTNNRIEYAFKQQAGVIVRVTWTGDGTSNRQIPHGLGVPPGMVALKGRSVATGWPVYHRSIYPNILALQATDAAFSSPTIYTAEPTATNLILGTGLNASGQTYVAYLFAHDPSADGIVQCGSSVSASNGQFTIPHGWAGGAQWVLIKRTDTAEDWFLFDAARSPGLSGSQFVLRPNTSQAEQNAGSFAQTAGSFTTNVSGAQSSYVWAIIRAPT